MKKKNGRITAFIIILIVVLGCIFLIACPQKVKGTYYLKSMRGVIDNVNYDVVPGLNYFTNEYGGNSPVIITKEFVTVEFGDKLYKITIQHQSTQEIVKVFTGSFIQDGKSIKAKVGNEEEIWEIDGRKITIRIEGLTIIVYKEFSILGLFYK